METVFVCGHKNPDMDSICSAYAYARLKNILDPAIHYKAIRCGTLNRQSKAVFEKLAIQPPVFMRDIKPGVSDVLLRDIRGLNYTDPVYKAIELLDLYGLSLIPVFSVAEEFRGIITIHEISNFFIRENLDTRPFFSLVPENIKKVIPGYFYRSGTPVLAPVMIGAMSLPVTRHRLKNLNGVLPVLISGLRNSIVQLAIDMKFPGIILVGMEDVAALPFDLSKYTGFVYISKVDTSETIRLLRLSVPVSEILNAHPKTLHSDEEFDRAKSMVLRSEHRGMPVFEGKKFAGVVTRRCFINRPVKKLILVDHNEIEQSIPGAGNARIIEILDHHRTGMEKNREPVRVNIKPLGSTCTLVFQEYLYSRIDPDPKIAALLVSGILSDTVMLKSPTTTESDQEAVEKLSQIAGIDWRSWCNEMFRTMQSLDDIPVEDIINDDFKEYEHSGIRFGIAQVEALNLDSVNDIRTPLLKGLGEKKKQLGLDWMMLLVTDVMAEESVLLSTEFPGSSTDIVYPKLKNGDFFLDGILSRKKQLLPEILRYVEERNSGEAG